MTGIHTELMPSVIEGEVLGSFDTLGLTDGTADGIWEGTVNSWLLGAAEGDCVSVGSVDGVLDGKYVSDGTADGNDEGECVSDGPTEGIFDGENVVLGATDGMLDGD